MLVDDGPTRLISVGGGKGGVGKSIISSNLAVSLSQLGHEVILIDADLGASNQHTLLGLRSVDRTLQSYLDGEVPSLEEAISPTPIPRLRLIAGASADPGSADAAASKQRKLAAAIPRLKADVVVIDCGAGSTRSVLDLYRVADVRLAVLLPQLTSLQNAYAFLKSAVHRTIHFAATLPEQKELCALYLGTGETSKIRDFLCEIEGRDPVFHEMVMARLRAFSAQIVGNQVVEAKDRDTLTAITRMFEDYLSLSVPIVGTFRFSRAVQMSVNSRRPIAFSKPTDNLSLQMRALAASLADIDVLRIRADRAKADPLTRRPIATSAAALMRAAKGRQKGAA